MKVLHISRKDTGGASTAMLRTYEALKSAEADLPAVESDLLLLYKNQSQSPGTIFRDLYKSLPQRLKLRWQDQEQLKITQARRQVKHTQQPDKVAPIYFKAKYNIFKHPMIQQADILHMHHIMGFVDWQQLYQKWRKPVVWTFHDMAPFTGGYPYELTLPPEIKQRVDQLNIAQKKAWFSKVPTYGIATSRQNLEKAQAYGAFSSDSLRHIPYSIDMDVFRPFDKGLAREVFRIPPQAKVLMFIAVDITNKRKGISILLDCLPTLAEKGYHLLVVGSHTQAFPEVSHVHLLGRINEARLLALAYSAADIFATPASEEAFGQTTLEALACGTPAVSFPTAGALDLIQPGINGLICEDRTHPSAFAESIDQCFELKLPPDQVRGTVQETYTHQRQARLHHELYTYIQNTHG